MIPFDEALAAVLGEVRPLGTERVPLCAAEGQCLAEEVVSDTDMPRFDNSSVDGFGVRVDDVQGASEGHPVELPVVGLLPAGEGRSEPLAPGTTLKIMTGAALPPGVEAVVMREDAVERGDRVQLTRPVRRGENVRPRGGEYAAGATLLAAGTRVTPPVAAVLASLGLASVEAYRMPRLRIVVTGNEVVPAGTPLAPGQIYDSNRIGLEAAARALGLSDVASEHCQDDLEAIAAALQRAIGAADVVVTSGGVSVGDCDFVRDAFASLGARARFWRVAIKPGKPNYFGVWEGDAGRRVLLFGLPGNPVGALLSFERLVRPALLAQMGAGQVRPSGLKARLTAALRKEPGRLEFVRGVLRGAGEAAEVEPLPARESHMLVGLARANCIIAFPAEARRLEAGSLVDVEILRWS